MYSIVASEDTRDISQNAARICLGGILILSAALRFWQLQDNPPISYFEQIHTEVARNISIGKLEFQDQPWTFFTPEFFYPPFFHFLCAIFFTTLAKATVTIRFITGVMGVLTTFGIYLIGKEIASRRTGLYSALLFSLYTGSILYNRLVLPQNLAMMLLSFAFYFMMRGRDTKNTQLLRLSALLIAFSSLTVYSSLFFVILLYAVVLLVDKTLVKQVLIATLGPVILLFLVMLIWKFNPVVSDIGRALLYGTTETNQEIPPWAFFKGIRSFLFFDWYIILGILGTFFFRGRYPWYIFFAILITTLSGFRGQAAYQNILYPGLIISLPFILLGTGRMTQIIIDNFTSLVNTLLNLHVPVDKIRFSPGRVIALIGFYLVVMVILYYVVPQVRISFSNTLAFFIPYSNGLIS